MRSQARSASGAARGRRGRSAAAMGLILASSGCFAYVPTEPAMVEPGRDVRVELTRIGFASLVEIPNQSGPDILGSVVGLDDVGLRLRVPVVVRTEGSITRRLEQEVLVPREDIVGVQTRRLSRVRTVVAVAGMVAAAVVAFASLGAGGNQAPELPPQPEDPEAGLLPFLPSILSIPFP